MTCIDASVDPRRLVAAHALAAIAVALPWPALLAAIWRIADDSALVGLAGAARFAPCVLLSALLGGLGDRIGRLRAVRLSVSARVVLVVAVAVLLLQGLPWPALAAATLSVAVGVPAFPSLAALLPQVSTRPEEDTNALVTWEISAFVVGPALGGLLLAATPSWSVAASVPLIVAAAVVLPRRVTERPPSVRRPRLRDGLHEVLAVPVVRRAIVTVMAVNVVIGALGVALLAIAETRWDAGVAAFGWLTAAQGLASLTAPLLARAVGRLSPGLAAQLVVVLPLAVVTLSSGWVAAAVPMALLGSGLTMVECRTTRMMQLGAPADYTAVALGVADSAVVAAAMAGALVAPWLLAALGPVGLLLGLAGGSAAVLGWGLRRGVRTPDLPAEPDAPLESRPAGC
ncbi:MAG: MFS transporter [Micropruina sp.]|uniref:MFS transporter n=1 Tax=Micropruina sp. TaxID=2737536 RepID=UPI0039E22392